VTILEALKSGTAAQHERVEALLALDGPPLTRARYATVVSELRALYAPLERALFARLDADVPAGWRLPAFVPSDRRKLPLLDRDLAALSLGTPPDAPVAVLPAVATVPAALGALYVLEGATLGGRVIARRLADLGLAPATGAAYFAGYGDATGAMWRGYGAQVSDFVARFGGADEVLRAAGATFDAFERWFTAPAAVHG
jgi:heme oxygenase (biliverdin-IX-beta and delta-forming)